MKPAPPAPERTAQRADDRRTEEDLRLSARFGAGGFQSQSEAASGAAARSTRPMAPWAQMLRQTPQP